MKIYTRTGDEGKTNLLGGVRVGKDDPRVDCYGLVDELNAAIGWAAVAAAAQDATASLAPLLYPIQNHLFVIGSHLAVADQATVPSTLPVLDEAIIGRLEMEIDAAEAQLPPLRNFVLPGGCELAARLHLARTVCRRAERRIVQFAADRPLPGMIITCLNRLSDWLFVHARLANHLSGIADVPWRAK